MKRYDYFEGLSRLCEYAMQAVTLCCAWPCDRRALDGWLDKAEHELFLCEQALFFDFLPPLDRESIAACAHALRRVTYVAVLCAPARHSPAPHKEEARLYPQLAERLRDTVSLLQTVRRPEVLPDREGFAHALSRLRPYASSPLSPLCLALSHAFDTVVESMLTNI